MEGKNMKLEDLKNRIKELESNLDKPHSKSNNLNYVFLSKKVTPLTCVILPVFDNEIEKEFFVIKRSVFLNGKFYTLGYNETLNNYANPNLVSKAFSNTSEIRKLASDLGLRYNQFRDYILNINKLVSFPIFNLNTKNVEILSWTDNNPLEIINKIINTISNAKLDYSDVVNYQSAHALVIDLDDNYRPQIKISKQKIAIDISIEMIKEIADVIYKNNISQEIETDLKAFIETQENYIQSLKHQINRFDNSDDNSVADVYIDDTLADIDVQVENPVDDIGTFDDIDIPGLDDLINMYGK